MAAEDRDVVGPQAAAGSVSPASTREMWTVTSVVTFGAFLTQLDATIVNVSLSTLAQDLHSSLSTIHWVTSGYLLALALVLPLNGWLVDRFGAKRIYIWCISAFTLTSAMCGLAWSSGSLITFRIMQGLSGGLLAPMTQLMMARVAGNRMAEVVGFAAVPVLLAPLLGPVAAGAILHYGSWRWLFLVNVPIGAIAIAMVVSLLPSDRNERRRRSLDFAGLLLLAPAMVLLLYALDRLPALIGLATLLPALVLLAAFLYRARAKGEQALIRLDLFSKPAFTPAVVVQFFSNGVSFAGQMLLPLYLLRACGRSPTEVGFLLAPLGVGMMCGYPLMGFLTKRFGVRPVSLTGALLALAGTLLLAFPVERGLVMAVFIPALFLRGAGMSAVGVPTVAAAYASIAREDVPMASTALNIVQRLGGPTLTTVISTFLAWRISAGGPTVAPYSQALLVLAGLHALLALAALRLPEGVNPDKGSAKSRGPGSSSETSPVTSTAPQRSDRSEKIRPCR